MFIWLYLRQLFTIWYAAHREFPDFPMAKSVPGHAVVVMRAVYIFRHRQSACRLRWIADPARTGAYVISNVLSTRRYYINNIQLGFSVRNRYY